MRLTTKLSAFIIILSFIAMLLILIGCVSSVYLMYNQRVEERVQTLTTEIDQALLSQSPAEISRWVQHTMVVVYAERVELSDAGKTVFTLSRRQTPMLEDEINRYVQFDLPLLQHPGMTVSIVVLDPTKTWFRSLTGTYTLAVVTIIIVAMILLLLIVHVWLNRQWRSVKRLEKRAEAILAGDRSSVSANNEWPRPVSEAFDVLLTDLQEAGEQRLRIDTLIRTFAAQDSRTGLNNRLFFDNQLATLLEDQEAVGMHGVVMMVRLPDLEMLDETLEHALVEEYLYDMVNMLSTFVLRYPGALLARYFQSDFAVLLPYGSLKEANSMADQLINAVDTLPPMKMIDRDDLIHIGICGWRSGQTVAQVMDSVDMATRQATLLGGNNWSNGEGNPLDAGRGSVRWRTLLENIHSRGGPRLYQKPALLLNGNVHHREIMTRIFDGDKEVLAAEFMPLVSQFGMANVWDRQLVARIAALSELWRDEMLAVPVTSESLLQRPFVRWLYGLLLECTKPQRKRFLFELAEADVCQYFSRLAPVIRGLRTFGCQVIVVQAGLTVVSSAYIKQCPIDLIKLDPGLVRNIDRRTENQLFVQSLLEECKPKQTKVFATGVRTQAEWQTLVGLGVAGGQGDLFAASQPVNSNVKKYSRRYQI